MHIYIIACVYILLFMYNNLCLL